MSRVFLNSELEDKGLLKLFWGEEGRILAEIQTLYAILKDIQDKFETDFNFNCFKRYSNTRM